jgi:DNA polymerase/3'-5' exonuclease PolX
VGLLFLKVFLESFLKIQFGKELNQNIPKEVMLRFKAEVTEAAQLVDPDFQVYLVGSFRREEKEFHDVDFIGNLFGD